MNCASCSFGCPGLAAKGRRNRLNTISQLPRHQKVSLAAFPSFPERGCLKIFCRSFLLVTLALAALAHGLAPGIARAQFATPNAAGANGGSCTSGYAWPDSGGHALVCASGTWQLVNDTIWSTSGSNIYFNGGNVGIGTTAPQQALDFGNVGAGHLIGFGASYAWGMSGSDVVQFDLGSAYPSGYKFDTAANTGLFINSSGNVGIGTTAPGAPLQVYSGSALEGISLRSGASGSYTAYGLGRTGVDAYLGVAGVASNWFAGSVAGDIGLVTANRNLALSTSNGLAPALYINTSGNVGIGTTSPGTALTVMSSDNVSPVSTSGGVQVRAQNQTQYATYDWGGIYNSYYMAFNAVGDGTNAFFFQVNGADKMRILSNGNVGIGTTAPLQPLQVNGNILISSNDSTGELMLGSCCQSTLYRAASDGSLHIVSGQANIDLTPTSNVIVTQGNLGIGTTAPAANGLTINSVTPTLTFELSGASEESLYDDGSYFYVISTSGANGVKLQHGSTLWTSSSDRRIKKDITALPDSYGLSAVERLKPVTFHWRDPKSPQQLQMGLIAQDVQQVIPELVTRSAPTRYAPDGELGIEYSGLVIPLIEAVQELKGDNDNLRREFEAYKAAHP